MITMSPDHVYTLTLPNQQPRVLPSNTGILKDRGIIETRYYTEESRIRGTYVHAVTAMWDEQRMIGNDIDWNAIPAAYRGFCEAWRKFCIEMQFTPYLIEKALWHSADYATTLDRFGYVGSAATTALIEIKTGSVPKWVWLQIALQEAALRERLADGYVTLPNGQKHYKVHEIQRVAVCLSENGKYSLKEGWTINHTGDALAHVRSYHSAREYK